MPNYVVQEIDKTVKIRPPIIFVSTFVVVKKEKILSDSTASCPGPGLETESFLSELSPGTANNYTFYKSYNHTQSFNSATP